MINLEEKGPGLPWPAAEVPIESQDRSNIAICRVFRTLFARGSEWRARRISGALTSMLGMCEKDPAFAALKASVQQSCAASTPKLPRYWIPSLIAIQTGYSNIMHHISWLGSPLGTYSSEGTFIISPQHRFGRLNMTSLWTLEKPLTPLRLTANRQNPYFPCANSQNLDLCPNYDVGTRATGLPTELPHL